MIKHILETLLLLLAVFTGVLGGSCDGNETSQSVLLRGNLLLPCITYSEENSLWAKDSDIHLFIGKLPGNTKQLQNVRLGTSYTLIIEGAMIENEGIYTCKSDGILITTHCVKVVVVPDLYILVDGNTSNLTKALNLMQEYEFECVAVGSRPITPLQLSINGLSVSHNTTETYNENRIGTSNSSIRISHRVDTNVIRIECVTEAQYINGNKSVSTELNVVPGHSILYNGSPSPPKIYVSEKMELVLKCRTTSSKRPNVYWLRDGHNITKSSAEIDLNFHVSYEGGNEGEIVSVLSIDVGEEEKTMNITCTSASNLQIMRSLSVLLIVYQHPRVDISLDGVVINGTTTYVQLGSFCSIGCFVHGNHIDFISLIVEENSGYITQHTSTNDTLYYNRNTEGHSKVVDILVTSHLSIIKCRTFGHLDFTNVSNQVELRTIVVPKISFMFEEKTVLQRFIHIAIGQSYTLRCAALEARPMVQLTWVYEKSEVHVREKLFVPKPTTGKKGLWDCKSDIHFRLDAESAMITCLAVGSSKLQESNRTITLLSLGEPRGPSTYILIFCAVFVVLVLTGLPLIYRLKFSGGAKSQVQLRKTTELNEEPLDLGSVIERSTKESIETNQEWTAAHRSLQHQQSMSLPKLPDESTASVEVYYSRLTEGSLMRNVYTKREICFVAQLKKGMLLNRWIGTINKTPGNKTCVFISLPSDDKEMKNELQWDVYVQKLMEFPDHVNVIKTEGICIDNAHIYLLQEYQPVGSLDELLRDVQETDGKVMSSHTLDLCLQVMRGMEFIVTHGFLHPGLSLRRILMTENKYCKLYDFCLKEDASRKVIAMKKMETIPELPNEAKARNEYTWASDSWSTGTCVWKMISYGSNQTLEQILGLRDQKYPFFVLECLMNCKSIEVADRPPLRDLRTTLRTWLTDQSMEINEIGLTRKLSCESPAEDGYTPMEGNIEINEIGLTRKLSCESLTEDEYTPMEGNIVMVKH